MSTSTPAFIPAATASSSAPSNRFFSCMAALRKSVRSMYFACTVTVGNQLDSRVNMTRTAYQILVKVDLQDRRHGVDNVDQFKILKQRRIACTFGRVFGLVICHLLDRPANAFELDDSSRRCHQRRRPTCYRQARYDGPRPRAVSE
jgi:hypothetical protein